MTAETAVATTEPNANAIVASEDLETLRAAIGPELTNPQLKLALLYAQKVGADLFARDIYPVIVDQRLTFITSIDFARSRALASGQYQGQSKTEYGPDCDCEGEEIKLERRHPEWAEVPIHRDGFLEPMVQRAYFHEYAPLERAKGDGGGWVIKFTWRKMPHVMVAKVSEMLGLRKAFPRDLQQLYINEEMEQAGVIEGQSTRLSAGDIGAEPPLPEGLEFTGVVYKVDGPRQVVLSKSKALAWASDMGLPDTTHKTEVAFTISRRRHTSVILGELAQAVAELKITNDETVATDGVKVELDYPGRGEKPKKKEIHRITRFAVRRNEAWITLPAEAAPSSVESADQADDDEIEAEVREVSGEPEAVPTPTGSGTQASTAPEAQASSSSSSGSASTPAAPSASETGSGPSAASSPAAAPSTTPPTTADEPSSPTEPPAPSTTSSKPAEEKTPGSGLADADVDPARGGSTDPGDLFAGKVEPATFELPPTEMVVPNDELAKAMALPVWQNDKDKPLDLKNCVVLEVVRASTSDGQRMYGHLWLREGSKGLTRFEAVMGDSEALAQGVYDEDGMPQMVPGLVVHAVGTWVQTGALKVVMLTALVPATA